MRRIRNVFRIWLPFAVVVTAFCALAYMTVQQALRQGADDPQIQLAEDAAAALNRGERPDALVPGSQVDMATSLAPFLLTYDGNGKPLASSALLDGKMPEYPMGALDAARRSGENRVTWQPREGVRVASVAVPYRDGFVVGGRSLREVEKREAQTQTIAFTIWVLGLVAVLAAVAFGEYVLGGQ
jgi:hypothetical protein